MPDGLPQSIQQHLQALAGEVGFAVKNLSSGQTILFNDRLFWAASTIKLPVMSAFFTAAEEQRLAVDDVYAYDPVQCIADSPALEKLTQPTALRFDTLVRDMMIVSDNTATNIVIEQLGIPYIQQWLKQMGLQHTQLNRRMMDLEARAQGIDNWTTPYEMLVWLEKLVTQQLGSPQSTQAMLDILYQQQDREKIPHYFTPPIQVANKPGELPGCRSDVGYVHDSQHHVLLSIFCDHLQNDDAADDWIAQLAILWWHELTNT